MWGSLQYRLLAKVRVQYNTTGPGICELPKTSQRTCWRDWQQSFTGTYYIFLIKILKNATEKYVGS